MKTNKRHHTKVAKRYYARNVRLRDMYDRLMRDAFHKGDATEGEQYSKKSNALCTYLHVFFDAIEARYGRDYRLNLYSKAQDYALGIK